MRAVFFRPAQVRVRPDNSPVTGRQGVFGASLALRSEIHSPSSLQPRELLGVFASSASDALEETSTVHETVTGTWGPEFRTADGVLLRRDVNGDQDVWDLPSLPAGVSLIQNANTSVLKVRLSTRVTFSGKKASKSFSFANGRPASALASAREFYVLNYAGTPVPKTPQQSREKRKAEAEAEGERDTKRALDASKLLADKCASLLAQNRVLNMTNGHLQRQVAEADRNQEVRSKSPDELQRENLELKELLAASKKRYLATDLALSQTMGEKLELQKELDDANGNLWKAQLTSSRLKRQAVKNAEQLQDAQAEQANVAAQKAILSAQLQYQLRIADALADAERSSADWDEIDRRNAVHYDDIVCEMMVALTNMAPGEARRKGILQLETLHAYYSVLSRSGTRRGLLKVARISALKECNFRSKILGGKKRVPSTIKKWVKRWEFDQTVGGVSGKMAGIPWMEDEELVERAKEYVNAHTQPKGQANMTRDSFIEWVNTDLLKDWRADNEVTKPFTPRTGGYWLHQLGFRVVHTRSSAIYIDRHNDPDIVTDRQLRFIPEFEGFHLRTRRWCDDGVSSLDELNDSDAGSDFATHQSACRSLFVQEIRTTGKEYYREFCTAAQTGNYSRVFRDDLRTDFLKRERFFPVVAHTLSFKNGMTEEVFLTRNGFIADETDVPSGYLRMEMRYDADAATGEQRPRVACTLIEDEVAAFSNDSQHFAWCAAGKQAHASKNQGKSVMNAGVSVEDGNSRGDLTRNETLRILRQFYFDLRKLCFMKAAAEKWVTVSPDDGSDYYYKVVNGVPDRESAVWEDPAGSLANLDKVVNDDEFFRPPVRQGQAWRGDAHEIADFKAAKPHLFSLTFEHGISHLEVKSLNANAVKAQLVARGLDVAGTIAEQRARLVESEACPELTVEALAARVRTTFDRVAEHGLPPALPQRAVLQKIDGKDFPKIHFASLGAGLQADVYLKVGKGDDGYWTGKRFVEQSNHVLVLGELRRPDEELVYLVDHSSNHEYFGEHGLRVQDMCVHDHQKSSPVLRSTTWKDANGADHQQDIGTKGLQTVLAERGLIRRDGKKSFNLDDHQLNKEGLQALLAQQPDFASEKCELVALFEKKGHRILWGVKCHPELMYIEQKWGLVKPKIRKRVNGSSVGFMAMVFEEMRAAPLLSIQRFARKCRDTLAIYKEGREYEEVPGLLKEKKSHRTGLL